MLLRYRYNSVMLELNNKTLLLREKVNANLFSSNIRTWHDSVTTLVWFQNPDSKILDNIYPKWKTTHKSTSFQQPYKQLSIQTLNKSTLYNHIHPVYISQLGFLGLRLCMLCCSCFVVTYFSMLVLCCPSFQPFSVSFFVLLSISSMNCANSVWPKFELQHSFHNF